MKGGDFGYTFSEPEEKRGVGTEMNRWTSRSLLSQSSSDGDWMLLPPLSRKGKSQKHGGRMCHVTSTSHWTLDHIVEDIFSFPPCNLFTIHHIK